MMGKSIKVTNRLLDLYPSVVHASDALHLSCRFSMNIICSMMKSKLESMP